MSKLDRISAKTPTTKKASNKIAATLSDELKESVDQVINLKAQIKAATAELSEKETNLIEVTREQQDEHAFNGNYSKSYELAGNNGTLTYTTTDRFSIPQEPETIQAIKDLIGDKFPVLFIESTKLSIKPEILENETVLDQILTACENAGLDLNSIFDKTVKLEATDDLDVKQYQLKGKLNQFRTLVKQYKPSLR